jgi:hypothetical protein
MSPEQKKERSALEFPTSIPRLPSISVQVSTHTWSPSL